MNFALFIKYMLALLVEAGVVGLATVLVGYLATWIVSRTLPSPNLPEACLKWNKYYSMEVSLFLTGFLVHLLAEWTGVNGWYCRTYTSRR